MDEQLVAFLRARLDEDENRIVNGWDSDAAARIAVMWTGGEPGYATVAADSGDDYWVTDGREVAEPRHVRVLFDPKRELRDVEAKRRLIDWLDRLDERVDDANWWSAPDTDDARKLLARPYADHPDYRADWRV